MVRSGKDIDPFLLTCMYPFDLPKLTCLEEILISKVHVMYMFMYRLQKSHTVCYKGNVRNFQQDNDALVNSILCPTDVLPRRICNLFIIYL